MITCIKKLPRRIVHTIRAAVRSSCLGAELESGGKDTLAACQYLACKVGKYKETKVVERKPRDPLKSYHFSFA